MGDVIQLRAKSRAVSQVVERPSELAISLYVAMSRGSHQWTDPLPKDYAIYLSGYCVAAAQSLTHTGDEASSSLFIGVLLNIVNGRLTWRDVVSELDSYFERWVRK